MRAQLRSLTSVLFRRGSWEQHMRDELDFHVRERADTLAAEGVPPGEALRRARLEFGAMERWKEQCREAQGASPVDELTRHLRDAFRSARRNPGFVAVAVLSLALGIGANLAVFGFVHQLLLSPLPVYQPDELRQVVLSTVRRNYYRMPYPKYQKLRDEFAIFRTIFGWGSVGEVDFRSAGREGRVQLTLVTGNFFDGLGVRPALGRMITPDDDKVGGGANVAVLSYHLWQSQFGGDPAVLGREVGVGQLTVQVVGVTPPEFLGPEPSEPKDLYVPIHAIQPTRPALISGPGMMWMYVMARLKPEVSEEAAAVRLREGWAVIDKLDQPRRGDNTRPEHMVLEDGSHGYSELRIDFSRPVVVLMGLVAIVFLIACANIASLLFVRASRRAGELAVRVALGAGRGALVRQWMTECLLLALAGGAAGVLLARWITDLLLQFVPEASREPLRFQATPEMLLVAAALTVVAACLFGLLPTLRASTVQPNDVLRASGPTGTVRRGRVAEIVLAAQLAASLVLVAGALLFAQTLRNLNGVETGYEREAVVYARARYFQVRYPREQLPETVRQILERLRSSPLFTRVSVGPVLSGEAGGWGWTKVPGYVFAPDEDNVAFSRFVAPGYFATVGIPLLAGRDLEERDYTQDAMKDPPPVVVSERLAKHYFGSARAAIGKQIGMGTRPSSEIVGVVADIVDGDVRSGRKEIVYWPMPGNTPDTIVARLAPGVDPRAAEAELRASIAAYATAKPVEVETGLVEDHLQETLSQDRLVGELSMALGLLGVFLAALGLFGAIAHWAAGRTREIAIRLTLGATPGHIARLVFRRGLAIITLGIAVGVPVAVASGVLIQPLLFGVTARDSLTHATAALILIAVGLLAACWPAWRAARVNALEVLRWE
jgi:macrolide transport system ATP-binding/permease protein